jgi:ankyrin repeat protein
MRVSRELRDFTTFAGKGQHKRIKAALKKNPAFIHEPQPMLEAARMGQAAVIHTLLENGADVNISSKSHEIFRPLHCAISRRAGIIKSRGHLEVVQTILDADVDVGTRAIWYLATPLATAAITGQQDMIDLILPYVGDLDIFSACVTGKIDQVRKLIEDEPDKVHQIDEYNNMQPLHYCAASSLGVGNTGMAAQLVAIVDLLVKQGADPNAIAKINRDFYPITWAHYSGNISVGKTLVRYGGDSITGLKIAIDHKDAVWLKQLLETGSDINQRDEMGDTPLHGKLRSGTSLSQIKFLLANHADLNLKSELEGWTALHLAAFFGRSDHIIQLLIEHGADVNERDTHGKTPLTVALSAKRLGAAKILKHYGVTK